MADLKRQAAQARSPSAGASMSAKAAASSSQQHDSRGKADDDSPRSNMSSPWGTDVSLHCCAYVVCAFHGFWCIWQQNDSRNSGVEGMLPLCVV